MLNEEQIDNIQKIIAGNPGITFEDLDAKLDGQLSCVIGNQESFDFEYASEDGLFECRDGHYFVK